MGKRDTDVHSELVHFQKDADLGSASNTNLVITNRAPNRVGEVSIALEVEHISTERINSLMWHLQLLRKPDCPRQGTCGKENGWKQQTNVTRPLRVHWL